MTPSEQPDHGGHYLRGNCREIIGCVTLFSNLQAYLARFPVRKMSANAKPIQRNTSIVNSLTTSLETDSTAATSSAPQRALRICLLGYRSAPFVGGQGIYIKYLSKALVDAGHQVDVISGPPYPDLDPRVNLIKMPSLDLFSAPNHVTALRTTSSHLVQ